MSELPRIVDVTSVETWRILTRGRVIDAGPLAPRHSTGRQRLFVPDDIATLYEPNGAGGWRIRSTIINGTRYSERHGLGTHACQDHFNYVQLGQAEEWIRAFAITHRPVVTGGRRSATATAQ